MKDEDYILIERFFAGELSESEIQVFEDRCAQEKDLNDYFRKAKIQQAWLKEQSRKKALRADLEEVHQQAKTKKSNKNIFRLSWLNKAAAILIVLGIGLWFLNPFGDSTSMEHRPLSATLGAVDDFSMARDAFNNGKYDQAKPLLEKLLEDQTSPNPELLRALGICQLEMKEYDTAMESFEKMKALSAVYNNAGDFYQGVIFFKTNRVQEAENQFIKIPSDSYYYKFSKAILNKK